MDRGKRTLFIIDSSATYLFYMGMLLKRLEYAVRTFTTADDALNAMDDPLPSLVITETNLPGVAGVTLLKRMKQNARLKEIPVIVHTSDRDAALHESCRAAGCAGIITKPSDPDTIYKAIQAATESTPRRNIRIDTSLRVEVGDDASSPGSWRTEEVTALSEGGLYIKTAQPGPVHSVVALKIHIRGKEVRATATVQYSSTKTGGQHKFPGMGMKFVSIAQEDRDLIAKYIREQLERGLSC